MTYFGYFSQIFLTESSESLRSLFDFLFRLVQIDPGLNDISKKIGGSNEFIDLAVCGLFGPVIVGERTLKDFVQYISPDYGIRG